MLAVLLIVVASHAVGVNISNVTPRRSGGDIMDAHDSRFQHKDGIYYWYYTRSIAITINLLMAASAASQGSQRATVTAESQVVALAVQAWEWASVASKRTTTSRFSPPKIS